MFYGSTLSVFVRKILIGGDKMRYYPGDPSQYRGKSAYHRNSDQPKEGSRFVERIYSIKDGKERLIRENVYEYRYGITKSGRKSKIGRNVLVETIDYTKDQKP